MRTRFLRDLLTILVLGAPLGASQHDNGMELGELGTIYPQPADVISEDALVNQDETGGAHQELLSLAGTPEGYAGVWRDTRNGNMGLYLGLLDPAGERMAEERSVNEPLTSRQFSPAVAIGPDLLGGVAWFLTSQGRHQPHLRLLDGPNGWARRFAEIPLGNNMVDVRRSGASDERGGGRDAGGRGAGGRGGGREGDTSGADPRHRPALAIGSNGRGLAVWLEYEEVHGQRFHRGGGGWQQVGEPFRLNTNGPPAAGEVVIARSPDEGLLCAWSTPTDIGLWSIGGEGGALQGAGGSGVPLEIVAGVAGGWWMLVRDGEDFKVRHLDAQLRIDRDDLSAPGGPHASCSIAAWRGGVALLTEGAGRDDDERTWNGPIELNFYGADGRAALPQPVDLPGPSAVRAKGPLVASAGPQAEELLVAWTDMRNGNYDVYYLPLSLTDLTRGDQRWNSDGSSSNQDDARCSSNGQRAVIVWEDKRFGDERAFGRLLDASGRFLGEEFQIGLDPGGEGLDPELERGQRPAVAMMQDGRFLVVWKSDTEAGVRLRAQSFLANGAAASASWIVDAENDVGGPWAPAVVALPDDRGYAVAWTPVRSAPLLLIVDATGARALGEPQRMCSAAGLVARNPALCMLDDGRLVGAWDSYSGGEVPRTAVRIFDASGRPAGPETILPSSPNGEGDIDPSLAPGPEGGFVLCWTGNEGPTRDILVAQFDRDAKHVSGPFYVSVKHNEQDYSEVLRMPDGRYALVWEDDISGRDHLHARMFDVVSGALGTRVTVNQRQTNFVEDRTAPSVAPMGEGFLTVWSDRRRSQGLDVYGRILGPAFDAVEGR